MCDLHSSMPQPDHHCAAFPLSLFVLHHSVVQSAFTSHVQQRCPELPPVMPLQHTSVDPNNKLFYSQDSVTHTYKIIGAPKGIEPYPTRRFDACPPRWAWLGCSDRVRTYTTRLQRPLHCRLCYRAMVDTGSLSNSGTYRLGDP